MPELRQIVLPRMDPVMETGKLVEWLKEEGDKISQGDSIAVVEGEKTIFNVESEFSGILQRLLFRVGEELKVGEPIAEVLVGTPALPPKDKK